MPIQPYCPGLNCPIRKSCPHFKDEIDLRKDIHFSHTPYDHVKKSCAYYPKTGTLEKTIKDLIDKRNGKA